ncbi:MAG: hypothetical protein LDLANPLL_01789 [Turneriella sp.]|nr:hypothetical protein [Turneriella sp.]
MSHFDIFNKKLAELKKSPPYVIYVGDNNGEIERLLITLRKRLENEFGSLDEVHLSGLDNEISSWHGELLTMPMFPSGRLILIRHAESLLKKIDATPKALGNYLHAIENPTDFTISLLQFRENKISKKFKALEDLALTYEETQLGFAEIVNEIAERAAQFGYKITTDTIEYLVEKCAAQQKIAFSAFDRLLTFRLHEKEIRIEDIDEVISQSESNQHFKLIDATAHREINECLHILETHTIDEVELFVAALIRLFSEALRFHYYKNSGMDLTEIGKIIGTRPISGYPLKKSAERWSTLVQKYNPDGIRFVMDALVRADRMVKSTGDAAMKRVLLTSFYLMLVKNKN